MWVTSWVLLGEQDVEKKECIRAIGSLETQAMTLTQASMSSWAKKAMSPRPRQPTIPRSRYSAHCSGSTASSRLSAQAWAIPSHRNTHRTEMARCTLSLALWSSSAYALRQTFNREQITRRREPVASAAAGDRASPRLRWPGPMRGTQCLWQSAAHQSAAPAICSQRPAASSGSRFRGPWPQTGLWVRLTQTRQKDWVLL